MLRNHHDVMKVCTDMQAIAVYVYARKSIFNFVKRKKKPQNIPFCTTQISDHMKKIRMDVKRKITI